LNCPGLLYIGETGQKLAERFSSHLSNIGRNVNTSDVAQHFNSQGHSIDDIVITGLLNAPEKTSRRIKEAKIIRKLGSLYPNGLNREEDSGNR
jgi:hypothetical protein